MNICIVGGGHIGTTLACYIKHSYPDYRITLYVRRPERFSERLTCNDIERGISYEVIPDCVTADASAAFSDADVVYIALPHFAVRKAFGDIAPFARHDVSIGVLPGGGGCELYFDEFFGDEATLFGVQRVPFTAKLVEYGKETNLKSWKPFCVVGSLRASQLEKSCRIMNACGIATRKAANYLAVALTPTNPILHTSRTHDLFRGSSRDVRFEARMKFYAGWTDFASKTMLAMDAELHRLIDAVGDELDLSSIRPLTEHYEAPTVSAMTAKINSIPTFQSVYAPLKESPDHPGMFVIDSESRLFTEDFPWGLAVFRGYCEIFGVDAPVMDEVLGWYADFMGIEYFRDGAFSGKDLAFSGVPQNYGISTPSSVYELYAR